MEKPGVLEDVWWVAFPEKTVNVLEAGLPGAFALANEIEVEFIEPNASGFRQVDDVTARTVTTPPNDL